MVVEWVGPHYELFCGWLMGHRSQSTLCEHKENCWVMVWHVTRPWAFQSARDSSKVYATLLRECAVKFLATHSSNPPTHTKGLCKSPSGLYRWDVNMWFYQLWILSIVESGIFVDLLTKHSHLWTVYGLRSGNGENREHLGVHFLPFFVPSCYATFVV